MKSFRFFISLFTVVVLTGCATKTAVDLKEPKRVLGRENDVRIDAQILGDEIAANAPVQLTYEIENFRSNRIALADVIPAVTYDVDERMITIEIGSEVPGNEFLPRLIAISSGERKSFTAAARMNIFIPRGGTLIPYPRFLRVRANFLGETDPFEKLIEIPEKAVRDPTLASLLFLKWVENNESVLTNAIPIRWASARVSGVNAETGADIGGRPRGRRRP